MLGVPGAEPFHQRFHLLPVPHREHHPHGVLRRPRAPLHIPIELLDRELVRFDGEHREAARADQVLEQPMLHLEEFAGAVGRLPEADHLRVGRDPVEGGKIIVTSRRPEVPCLEAPKWCASRGECLRLGRSGRGARGQRVDRLPVHRELEVIEPRGARSLHAGDDHQ